MVNPANQATVCLLPQQIYRADWLRQAEKQAAVSQNITLFDLMQRAGMVAFALARQIWPHSQHWLVLCGTGNNGGDGYIVARLAQQAGIQVTLLALNSNQPLPPQAATARDLWLSSGGAILPADNSWPDNVDLIIDSLLGSGLNRAPLDAVARLINQANRYQAPVLALDMPSGLLADSGATPGSCIQAQHTITFIALKPGLFTGQARDVAGQIHYHDLGLADWLTQQPTAPLNRYHAGHLSHWLAPRHPCAHKGEHGRLLLIGGDHGTGGAIRMSAEAALRTGAGLVRVLTHQENIAPILATRPELMADTLTPQTLSRGLQWADALVIGPGLGQQAWGRKALASVADFDKPMLWDADALNLLAASPAVQQANRIITPHPGEAARLLNCSVNEIESDRLHATERLRQRYGGAVLLKGAGSIVTEGKQCGILDVGNAGMATAGMGDILSGIIGGLLAQGLELYPALCAGGVAHGAAADWLAARYGTRGLLAMDLLSVLYRFVNPHSEQDNRHNDRLYGDRQ